LCALLMAHKKTMLIGYLSAQLFLIIHDRHPSLS
jgi:hypothetical protein